MKRTPVLWKVGMTIRKYPAGEDGVVDFGIALVTGGFTSLGEVMAEHATKSKKIQNRLILYTSG